MANFELKFIDAVEIGTFIKVNKVWKDCDYLENKNIISVTLYDSSVDETCNIWLDKSTAIKFAKTLRTEINKITESEVNNG